MKQEHTCYLYIFFLLFCLISNGQNQIDKKVYYGFFDGITGIENTDLHYGEVYQEKHRVKSKKTKFFPGPDFVLGTVVFNGQPYFDIPLKYDVFDDELLLLVNKRFGGDILELYKDRVLNFSIGKHLFVKIDNPDVTTGFYELILKNPVFSLLKKHRKSLRQLLGEKLVYYEFEDEKNAYFLRYQNTYHSIEKISDLLSIFSEYESELKSFEEIQDSSLSFDYRLESLMEYLITMLTSKHEILKGN